MVLGHSPRWEPHESTFDAGFNDNKPKEKFYVMTVSGRKSLSAATPRDNTYHKLIRHLWNGLQPSYQSALVTVLLGFAPSHVSKFKAVLESLSDAQFNVLVEALDFAPLPRFLKYLEIIALLPESSTTVQLPNTFSNNDASDKYSNIKTYTGCSSNETRVKFYYETCNGHSKKNFFSGVPVEWYQRVENLPLSSNSESLWKYVHATSKDVFLIIWEEFAKLAFAPKYVFPTQTPNDRGQHIFQGGLFYAPNTEAFLSLDRVLLDEYQRIYWEENTWVIETGYQDDTVRFLDSMEENSIRIRSIHLSFTLYDLHGAADLLANVQIALREENGGSEPSNIDILERFATRCDSYSDQLADIWKAKFYAIASLNLTVLTLDLRDAYGPDGVFLPSYP